jgi:uncharacterized membrane protein
VNCGGNRTDCPHLWKWTVHSDSTRLRFPRTGFFPLRFFTTDIHHDSVYSTPVCLLFSPTPVPESGGGSPGTWPNMEKDGIETDKSTLAARNGASVGGLHFRLLAEPEGQILLTGLGLATASVLVLTVGLFRSPDTAQLLMGMTASHVFFGRAAGMSFGYTLGFDHALVISVNMLIETILVLLFYPLFVFSWRRLLVLSFLKNFMERSRRAAEKNRDKIRKYGIPGLLVFVWLPFWMTGPLAGCIIGFLMGLRRWANMLVVLTGTFLAILGYAAVLKGLHNRLSLINPYAPFVLLALLVLIAIAAGLLHNGRNRKP